MTYEERRAYLGIEPHRGARPATRFHRGGECIEVEMISGPENPYRDMVVHSLQTWGGPSDSKIRTWESLSPGARMAMAKNILTGNALPLALELPDFYFEIRNMVRYGYDQVVRTRLGVTYSSEGTRDNDVADIGVMVSPRIWDNPGARMDFEDSVAESKEGYAALVRDGIPWSDARALIPQGILHRFAWDVNYMTLKNFLGKRMMLCMDYPIVTMAWKMRKVLEERYAVLALPLRPNCDYAKVCTMRGADRDAELTSNLFANCGRWPDRRDGTSAPNVSEFQVSSTEKEWLEQWVPGGFFEGTVEHDWAEAFEKDRRFFE